MTEPTMIHEDDAAILIARMGRAELERVSQLGTAMITRLEEEGIPVDRQQVENMMQRARVEILGSEVCGHPLAEWLGIAEAVEELRGNADRLEQKLRGAASSVLKQDGRDQGQEASNIE